LNSRWQVGKAKKVSASVLKSDAFMKITVRCQDVTEHSHRWAKNSMSIKVHVQRKTQTVLTHVYQPLFLMTFVSITTILTGFGMDLQSSFGDRASITLTLLLTIVATELPEHLKEVPQVNWLKGWAFNFVCCVILKDVAFILLWWATTYWNSQDIAISDPWKHKAVTDAGAGNVDDNTEETSIFFSSYEFPWYHRIWFLDGTTTVGFAVFWFWRVFQFFKKPYDEALDQYTPDMLRFDAKPRNAHVLGHGSYLRKYVVDRASYFLHEHWRAQYAHDTLRAMLQKAEKAKRISVVQGNRSATSRVRQHNNTHSINRHASVRTLAQSLSMISEHTKLQTSIRETIFVPPR